MCEPGYQAFEGWVMTDDEQLIDCCRHALQNLQVLADIGIIKLAKLLNMEV